MFAENYNRYEEYNEFGKLKIGKFLKRAGITRPFKTIKKKVIPAVVGATVGVLLPGKTVQRALGIKSKKAKKAYRIGRKAGTVVTGIAAAVVAYPIVAPMASGAASTIGGGIVSAGSGALALAKKGVGVVGDFFSEKGIGTEAAKFATKEIIEGRRPIPSELEERLKVEGEYMAKTGQVTKASLFGMEFTPTTIVVILGASALAYILFADRKVEHKGGT